MQTTHTPGPWAVQVTGGTAECVSATEPGLWAVVEGADYETRAANARLIAAAPAMLGALLDALPYVEDVLSDPAQLAAFKPGTVQRHAKVIRAAIAAATGEQ